jgi:hypothetical protein
MADLTTQTCFHCGVEFGLSEGHERMLRRSNANFYCPNGHPLMFSKKTSEVDELRAEVKTLKEQAAKDKATIEELAREVEVWRPASAEPPKTGT